MIKNKNYTPEKNHSFFFLAVVLFMLMVRLSAVAQSIGKEVKEAAPGTYQFIWFTRGMEESKFLTKSQLIQMEEARQRNRDVYFQISEYSYIRVFSQAFLNNYSSIEVPEEVYLDELKQQINFNQETVFKFK